MERAVFHGSTAERYGTLLVYLLVLYIFTYAYSYGVPIETIPDETAQLKNIYGMIQSHSLRLQYPSSYSVWTHYTYLLPTAVYWGGVYLFSDFSSVAEFKQYVLNNYQQVIPFLRLFTATLFFFALMRIKRVLEDLLGRRHAWFFFVFVAFNLLIVINVHYAKHWMADYAWTFIAIYLYYRALKSGSMITVLVAFFLFGIAVLSTPPFIVYSWYFLLLHLVMPNNGKKRHLGIDISLFLATLVSLSWVTNHWLGTGGATDLKLISDLFGNGYLGEIIFVFVDYHPVVFVLFVMSLVWIIISGQYRLLLLGVPFIGWLAIMTILPHFEPRYALISIIEGSLLATFFAVFLWERHKKILTLLAFLAMGYNGFIISKWLAIVDNTDTRLEARYWLKEKAGEKSFIVYNTFGFNYLPLKSETVRFLQQAYPNAVGTREMLHLRYRLKDGANGIILWKFDDAGYDAVDLVTRLKSEGYRVLFVNERFGDVDGWNRFDQPVPGQYKKVMTHFNTRIVKEIEPFGPDVANREQIGDVLLNFAFVLPTLWNLQRTGPVITIYEL